MLRNSFLAKATLGCLLLSANTLECRAQLASRPADEWVTTLEGTQRIGTLKIDEVIGKLGLKPGAVVADIGAGSGIFSRPLAKAIAPAGKLYAVDIDKDLLKHIEQRNREEKISNIVTVLGEFDDPKLPVRNLDVAFINDVLHHIKNRAVYLKSLASYMKPNGRIAIIEMDITDPNTPHKSQPELLVSPQDMVRWMSDAGFKVAQEHADLFPGTKVFLVFERK
jgi:ubiquinone/menaquinone biosynthesis C-methylase UbiE